MGKSGLKFSVFIVAQTNRHLPIYKFHFRLAKVDVYTRQSVEDLPSKNELSPTFLESSLLHGHEIVIHAEDISDGQVTVVVTNGYGNVNNG